MQLRPEYPIRTARLRLRPVTAADLNDMLGYRSDPDVCRYLPFDPMDAADLQGRIDGVMAQHELTEAGQSLTLAVEDTASGRVIGDVVLFFLSAEHSGGEIGYVFHPEVTGQGYASEATSALLDLAFDGLGLHRVIARLDARNVASSRLASRLGMRLEAHHRSSEMFKQEWADLLIYAILADEWREHRALPPARHRSAISTTRSD